MRSYQSTVNFLGRTAPTLEKATEFIRWAEQMTDLLVHIYNVDYDETTEDIVLAAKEAQDWEDE